MEGKAGSSAKKKGIRQTLSIYQISVIGEAEEDIREEAQGFLQIEGTFLADHSI